MDANFIVIEKYWKEHSRIETFLGHSGLYFYIIWPLSSDLWCMHPKCFIRSAFLHFDDYNPTLHDLLGVYVTVFILGVRFVVFGISGRGILSQLSSCRRSCAHPINHLFFIQIYSHLSSFICAYRIFEFVFIDVGSIEYGIRESHRLYDFFIRY